MKPALFVTLFPKQLNNLLSFPTDFANAVWTQYRATLNADGVTVRETAVNDGHGIFRTGGDRVQISAGRITGFSDLQADGRQRVTVRIDPLATGATFDLVSGTVIATTATGANEVATIKRLRGDIFRCTVSCDSATGTRGVAFFTAQDAYTGATAETFVGDVTKGVKVYRMALGYR